ncbi:IS1182 family transposase [Paenibacillus sp. GD4]|uniref:IS1182 family transposase n=1 Tax=Paenibacillus sp. GD4 TaxID=3068890 RepID=UPI0027963F7C|nr:IS1182 family transposase [Paenibacillus sp. GD4]MDQ1909925.1 IS1182 family transposase [Paenibacillus sp. GD4]
MFIQYTMDQLCLPMDLEMDIPPRHVARVINSFINRLDDSLFTAAYPGGGRDSYHPKMLTKIIVYAYSQRIYSSRQIAKAVRENIPFMWLAGRQQPDFRTINRFRSERMKEQLEKIFAGMLELLMAEGYIKLENYFVDGTKIEANANRYTFVWGKTVKKQKARLEEKVKQLFIEIEQQEIQEDKEHNGKDLLELGGDTDLTSESMEAALTKLEAKLKSEPKNKTVKKAVRQLRKDFVPRQQKYETQLEILGERNSFSKTDPDATFMRMKEDHMGNGQLKPGYNVQVGTENQFIVGYSLHQRPTDTRCLIPHLNKVKETLGRLPKTVIADAGYGGEENYAYLEKENMEALVKYNSFHKEVSRAWRNDVSRLENWTYNEDKDIWVCPNGRTLHFIKESKNKTDSGYGVKLRIYRSENCGGCPFKEKCTKSERSREIRVSMEYLRYKKVAREKLRSEDGRKLSVQRMIEVESVFGQMKNNRGFRRFLLRGLPKVSLEVGWLSLAHNLLKVVTTEQKRHIAGQE